MGNITAASRWKHRCRQYHLPRYLLAIVSFLVSVFLVWALPQAVAMSQGSGISQATVAAILDGKQVYIQNRQAAVGGVAHLREIIRTGNARTQLTLNTGAIARMTRNSIFQVGNRCVHLHQGTLLISGNANSCSPGAIVGVRGTTYTVDINDQVVTTIKLFEGEATISPPTDATTDQPQQPPILSPSQPVSQPVSQLPISQLPISQPIVLKSGQKVTIQPTGDIGTLQAMTAADFLALVQGPLFQDYPTPLPTTDKLQQSFETLFPGEHLPLSRQTTQNPQISQLCQSLVDLYRQNLRLMIDDGWNPPYPPSKGVWTVALTYDLTRSGAVQNIKIVQSSGYQPLDESAIARVYEIQPQFRPLPSCYPQESMGITHNFQLTYH